MILKASTIILIITMICTSLLGTSLVCFYIIMRIIFSGISCVALDISCIEMNAKIYKNTTFLSRGYSTFVTSNSQIEITSIRRFEVFVICFHFILDPACFDSRMINKTHTPLVFFTLFRTLDMIGIFHVLDIKSRVLFSRITPVAVQGCCWEELVSKKDLLFDCINAYELVLRFECKYQILVDFCS